MTTIKKTLKLICVGEDVEKLEPTCIADGIVKWGSHCRKDFQCLKMLYIQLQHDSAIPLLDTYPKEQKTKT